MSSRFYLFAAGVEVFYMLANIALTAVYLSPIPTQYENYPAEIIMVLYVALILVSTYVCIRYLVFKKFWFAFWMIIIINVWNILSQFFYYYAIYIDGHVSSLVFGHQIMTLGLVIISALSFLLVPSQKNKWLKIYGLALILSRLIYEISFRLEYFLVFVIAAYLICLSTLFLVLNFLAERKVGLKKEADQLLDAN